MLAGTGPEVLDFKISILFTIIILTPLFAFKNDKSIANTGFANRLNGSQAPMKPIVLPLLAVFTIFVSGLFPFMDAAAEDKIGVFKADAKKIHLTVWDENSEEDRQGKIFEGALESGERKKIQSAPDHIVFSYKLAGDDRSYGDNHRTCKNGNTIRVP